MSKASEESHLVTQLLQRSREGENTAKEELVEHVYSQLRRIAQRRLSRERSDHTLQPTELVHEAYLKMAGHIDEREWESRSHFFAAAAEAMRRILINYARSKNAVKRGSGRKPEAINVLDVAQEQSSEEILALDEAIQQLRESDPRLGELVHLRFFAGLSVEETGKVLGMSRRSVIRHWTFARAWLARALKRDENVAFDCHSGESDSQKGDDDNQTGSP